MKSVKLTLVLMLVVAHGAVAQEHHGSKAPKRATLMTGLGQHHHPIATTKPEAQRFFDQGLTLVFAFNHDEAVRSFQRAAEIDPKAAMPLWGIALALGPNINMDVDPTTEKAAYEAVQKALALAPSAPEQERAYIEALAKRYSDDPKADLKQLAVDYKNAMGELVKRYPDDLDLATLYAESAMDLRPWKLWNLDGTPAEGTEEIVSVLESVLKRDPMHPGANHYYIHAVEASPHPERALASAQRLETLVPAAGHLIHMPAHIYSRTGDYAAAATRNAAAAAADRAYISSSGVTGMYPLMYYSHNLHFLAYAECMAGRYADARKAADQLAAHIGKQAAEVPGIGDYALMTPVLVALRFHRWNDVLKMPAPDSKLVISTSLWHFARGVAYAATGDATHADAERQAFAAPEIPADAPFGFNTARDVLTVAAFMLDAHIFAAQGDADNAIMRWEKAVEAQDTLSYDEPPDWFYPTRESLGGALLKAGRYEDAERVFRADLDRNPRNGRSLFGLRESLKGQQKMEAANAIDREFAAAWKHADVKLRVEDL